MLRRTRWGVPCFGFLVLLCLTAAMTAGLLQSRAASRTHVPKVHVVRPAARPVLEHQNQPQADVRPSYRAPNDSETSAKQLTQTVPAASKLFGYTEQEYAALRITSDRTANPADRIENARRLVVTAKSVATELIRLPGQGWRATRAAVFFFDAPQHGEVDLTQLHWWLYTWQQLSLDGRDGRMDLVVFCAPAACRALPMVCRHNPSSGSIDVDVEGLSVGRRSGLCFFQELAPIATRDKVFSLHRNEYMSSIFCAYQRESAFLLNYEVLLRTDTDTFLSPMFIDWWPTRYTHVRGEQGYANAHSIQTRLLEVAAELQLQHLGIHNLGSTWYGPSQHIVALSRLTVALARYVHLRYYIDSPCKKAVPPINTTCNGVWEFTWPNHFYEGTVLLYAQELAANHLLGETLRAHAEPGLMDWDTSMRSPTDICYRGHLHTYHTPDDFSKHKFYNGAYDNLTLDTLDLTRVSDYCTFVATKAIGRGRGEGTAALARIGGTLHGMCRHRRSAARHSGLRGHHNLCLDHNAAVSSRDGLAVWTCTEGGGSQDWLWVPQDPPEGSSASSDWTLQPPHIQECLTAHAIARVVQLRPCRGQPNQIWSFLPDGPVSGLVYNRATDRCLAAPNSSRGAVSLEPCLAEHVSLAHWTAGQAEDFGLDKRHAHVWIHW